MAAEETLAQGEEHGDEAHDEECAEARARAAQISGGDVWPF
jgi:hypothetical protein